MKNRTIYSCAINNKYCRVFLSGMVFFILRHTIFPLLKWLFVHDVQGLEHLPKKGGFIVVSNHVTYADAPLLVAVLIPYLNRTVHFVAWKKLKTITFFRWVLTYFGGVFENGSMEKLIHLLKQKEIVGIYPEGSRTRTGKIQKVTHTGLGVLAAQTRVPVIPVHMVGGFEFWPYNKTLPSRKNVISFKIGKPVYYSGKKRRKDYLFFANKVMKIIARL